jgi:hypothetical protein
VLDEDYIMEHQGVGGVSKEEGGSEVGWGKESQYCVSAGN